MAKKKKRAEAESEAETKNAEEQVPKDQKLDFVNGDSQNLQKKKKKKKNSKTTKENGGEADGIPTVSIAVAGSIIDNAQSLELATRVRTLSPLSIFISIPTFRF